MKKLTKLKLAKSAEILEDYEMRHILGGNYTNDCPSGQAPCTCNGVDQGCKTIKECWESC